MGQFGVMGGAAEGELGRGEAEMIGCPDSTTGIAWNGLADDRK